MKTESLHISASTETSEQRRIEHKKKTNSNLSLEAKGRQSMLILDQYKLLLISKCSKSCLKILTVSGQYYLYLYRYGTPCTQIIF